jgi:hypothetical protein
MIPRLTKEVIIIRMPNLKNLEATIANKRKNKRK